MAYGTIKSINGSVANVHNDWYNRMCLPTLELPFSSIELIDSTIYCNGHWTWKWEWKRVKIKTIEIKLF